MTEEAVQKFVNALISGQVALHYFEELKHTPFYRHQFKQKLNRVIKDLHQNEKVFDKIQDSAENATDDVHDSYYEFIEVITKIPFYELKNAATVLQAYQKDPKRIEQITIKILKQK